MKIDWEQEMEKFRGELLQRTKEFLAIESVLDESSAGPGAPFGKGVAEALEYLPDSPAGPVCPVTPGLRL